MYKWIEIMYYCLGPVEIEIMRQINPEWNGHWNIFRITLRSKKLAARWFTFLISSKFKIGLQDLIIGHWLNLGWLHIGYGK